MWRCHVSIEVFFEMKTCQPVSLPAWQKRLSVEVILIFKFRSKDHLKHGPIFVEYVWTLPTKKLCPGFYALGHMV